MKTILSFLTGLIGIFMTGTSAAELIVLASPPKIDSYYEKVQDKIIDFQINYARQIIKNGDNVLILSTKKLYNEYADALGNKRVIISPMWDIWMRDFTLANPESPVMFRYTAAGQGGGKEGQTQSDEVQSIFYQLAKKSRTQF
ncbi:hypothetical protein [Piscirickettsia litoralis]|uniref:hypothetical protein n=1 Tax=Piscirickettsia litoralis TaxID=1891921 RepID=UPI001913D76B|nr:hypothetical protein [Piscirickettsia litoralis]